MTQKYFEILSESLDKVNKLLQDYFTTFNVKKKSDLEYEIEELSNKVYVTNIDLNKKVLHVSNGQFVSFDEFNNIEKTKLLRFVEAHKTLQTKNIELEKKIERLTIKFEDLSKIIIDNFHELNNSFDCKLKLFVSKKSNRLIIYSTKLPNLGHTIDCQLTLEDMVKHGCFYLHRPFSNKSNNPGSSIYYRDIKKFFFDKGFLDVIDIKK